MNACGKMLKFSASAAEVTSAHSLVPFISLAPDFRTHYSRMKNITFRADEDVIKRARLVAHTQRKSLNAAFREWLAQFAVPSGNAREAESLMKSLRHVKAGRCFKRDEMNER